ncbi:MAG TPA: hypothetical protein VND64_19620 [Pirellulales bacterium]|nr:hypothetical protein [Pirellulales bacterium]
MHDILESHVEYCWIDMPADPRETDVPAPLPRVARMDSLLAELAVAETGPCQSCADGIELPVALEDDEDFILELDDEEG